MGKKGLDVALITDDDNVYYLTGYYDYLQWNLAARPYWWCRATVPAC
ncbi:MAG: aminopeptidase P family N-terminal domain-containing protein [Ruegeria sp.]